MYLVYNISSVTSSPLGIGHSGGNIYIRNSFPYHMNSKQTPVISEPTERGKSLGNEARPLTTTRHTPETDTVPAVVLPLLLYTRKVLAV